MSDTAAAYGTGIRAVALLLALFSVALPLAGCGSSKKHNLTRQNLERADLAAVSKQLQRAEGSIEAELRSAREAWPSLYNGLPSPIPEQLQTTIAAASERASQLATPPFLSRIHDLTGPASGTASLYQSFWSLVRQGWRAIDATSSSIRGGPPSTASFRRANVPIYIQSVYDGHYDLSLIGEKVQSGFEKLGGSEAFGDALTSSEVEALASFYAPEAARLEPHPGEDLRH